MKALSIESATDTLIMSTSCKHPRVRIVAREDEVEYLECLECSEVFDSEELRDPTLDTPSATDPLEE